MVTAPFKIFAANKTEINDVSRPNIIFILTDDQRWSALGYTGNKQIQTPEMDKLATQGAYFSKAMVTTPICSASRASIFTGVHERIHRYSFQSDEVRKEFMDFAYPLLLKEAGYYTGFYGKFGVKSSGHEKMFDKFESYDRANQYNDYRGYFYKTLNGDTVHLTRYTGQKALDFIATSPKNKPFCLSLSFSAPHAHDNAPLQYFWQEESGVLYNDKNFPKAAYSKQKYFDALPQPVKDGLNRERWGWRYDTPEKYQHSVKGYYRMIYDIDREISNIRNKLKETGQDKKTIIIFMGDNGQFLGERQLAGKWLMYDNSIRVPLIIFDPRNQKHFDIEDMALNIDVPATILDLANVYIPETYQGKSLAPLLSGQAKSLNRDTVLIEHLWELKKIPSSEGVRTSKWKYLRYINDKRSEELYDLIKDPGEVKNLAGKVRYKKVLEELRNKNDELAEKYADPFAKRPTGLNVKIGEDKNVKAGENKIQFSWKIPSTVQSQKGYQIIVASSKYLIDHNVGDVWDSGNIRSNEPYSEIAEKKFPQNNTTYFWKVRYFDEYNRLSEYSNCQTFTTIQSEIINKNIAL